MHQIDSLGSLAVSYMRKNAPNRLRGAFCGSIFGGNGEGKRAAASCRKNFGPNRQRCQRRKPRRQSHLPLSTRSCVGYAPRSRVDLKDLKDPARS